MGTKDKSSYFSARLLTEVPGIGFGQVGTVTKLIRTRTGSSLANWKKKILDHSNATTPMTGTYYSCDAHPGRSENVKTAGLTSYVGDAAAYHQSCPSPPTISSTKASQLCTQKALKQIRAVQVKISGQVFLGELREAMHMLRHPAEGLRKAIKETYLDKLKRIKNKDPKRWQKAISQTWLEGAFGWRPFVNDLADASQAYQEVNNKLADRFENIRAVGKDSKFIDEFNGFVSLPAGSNMQCWVSRRTVDNAVCIIRGQVKASANTTPMDKLRIFGMSAGEFIPTVWELLPWSFLVDYFTNIGDILENSVTDTSNLAWSATATITERKRTASLTGDAKQTAAIQGPTFVSMKVGDVSSVIWKVRNVDRGLNANLNIGPLMFELPGNPIQQLNIVALWTQAYYGLHPQKSFRR